MGLELEIQRLRTELDQLKRSFRSMQLPLAEANLVRLSENISPLADDIAGSGYAVPLYIDHANTDLLTEFTPTLGASEPPEIKVYNYSEDLASSGAVFATARMPDGKRILLRGGGGSNVFHCFTPSGGIAGRDDLTMFKASCTIYDSSGSGVLSATETVEDVYNPSRSPIAGLAHVVAARNQAGILVAVVEDCGDEPTT